MPMALQTSSWLPSCAWQCNGCRIPSWASNEVAHHGSSSADGSQSCNLDDDTYDAETAMARMLIIVTITKMTMMVVLMMMRRMLMMLMLRH